MFKRIKLHVHEHIAPSKLALIILHMILSPTSRSLSLLQFGCRFSRNNPVDSKKCCQQNPRHVPSTWTLAAHGTSRYGANAVDREKDLTTICTPTIKLTSRQNIHRIQESGEGVWLGFRNHTLFKVKPHIYIENGNGHGGLGELMGLVQQKSHEMIYGYNNSPPSLNR